MTSQRTHNYTASYSMLPLFYWGARCCVTSYTSFYLLSLGYHNSTIGMIIAVAGIFAAFLQPIVAGYADHPTSMSLKRLVMMIAGIQLIGYVGLFTVHGRVFYLSGLLYGTEIALHQVVAPLINSLGTETINQGKRLNYGFARALGSIGYASIAFLLGKILEGRDSSLVLLVTMLFLGLMEFFLFVFPFQKTQISQEAKNRKGNSGIAFFRHYPRFTIVLVGCVLVYISHVLMNSFTLQVVQSKGGGAAQMGTATAIAALVELPVMFFFGYMLKKYPARTWFRISGFAFFIKILISLLAPNIPVFYAAQFFQMFGWGLIMVSSVFYVNSIMEEADRIKGQAYFTMTYTIGSVLGALIGGWLLDAFSANVMMIFGSAVSFVGALIMFFAS